MHSKSFMGPKTLEVLRNIPKLLCRYWWSGIFQISYTWKWILCWMYGVLAGLHSLGTIFHLLEWWQQCLKRWPLWLQDKAEKTVGREAMISQQMTAKKLPIVREISTSVRTKWKKIQEYIIVQKICLSAFHNYDKISEIISAAVKKAKVSFGPWF